MNEIEFEGKKFPVAEITPQHGVKRKIVELVNSAPSPDRECELTDFLMCLQHILEDFEGEVRRDFVNDMEQWKQQQIIEEVESKPAPKVVYESKLLHTLKNNSHIPEADVAIIHDKIMQAWSEFSSLRLLNEEEINHMVIGLNSVNPLKLNLFWKRDKVGVICGYRAPTGIVYEFVKNKPEY